MAQALRAAMIRLSRNQNYRERMKFISIALAFPIHFTSDPKAFLCERNGKPTTRFLVATHAIR